MKEITDSNFSTVDSLIERTLMRDAETTRARFATMPNAQLTAKLALSTASRGVLSGLAAKLMLYASGALLIGSAVYFFPSIGQPSHSATSAPVTSVHSATAAVQHSSVIATMPAKTEIAKSVSTHPAAIPHSARPLKLDEGDNKNIPHITDPKYSGPLK